MMAQLRQDFLIHAERDGQTIFDALGAQKKELLWIEDSNQRFTLKPISPSTRDFRYFENESSSADTTGLNCGKVSGSAP